MAKSQEIRDKFVVLRAQGLSLGKIVEQIDISKNTAISWNRKLAAQVELLKEEGLAGLCAEFRVERADRIGRLVGQIDAIETELSGRDLSDVETAPLVRLFIRLLDGIRKEVEPGRLELSGSVGYADPLERWTDLIREVGIVVPDAVGGPTKEVLTMEVDQK